KFRILDKQEVVICFYLTFVDTNNVMKTFFLDNL
ncbi:MAG: hypothetical protein ACI9XR_000913, partial [Flavobacterium sp.]